MMARLRQFLAERRHRFRQAIAICVALVLSMSFTCAAQDNQRVQISLKPVRWQTLPPEVRSVRFGPDGRGWLGLTSGETKEEDLRAALEREYREQTPQLRGASLALLEPDGRAWFYAKGELWGYDGQTWIQRKASSGSSFTGYCPTRGQLMDNHANRFAGGRAWFRDEQGIHVFDGKDWSYSALCPPINSERSLPRFSVSPNGKFAVAMTPRVPGRTVQVTNPDLWFWTADNPVWQRLPVVWDDKTSVFASFCVTDQGKLWCTPGNVLRILDLAASRDVVSRFAALIADLNHDNAQIREQTSQTLDAVGELILPRMQAAQASVESPEAKRRLDAIIQRVTGVKGRPASGVDQRPVVGGYQIHTVGDIFQDTSGRIFLYAMVSEEKKPEQRGGLLIAGHAGGAEFFPIGRVTNIRSPSVIISVGVSHGPILTPSGDALWIGPASFGSVRRLNLKTGQMDKQDYDASYGTLEAVDSDGLAILPGNGLAVFSPGMPDPRPVLKTTTHPVRFPVYIVATDGKLWVAREEGLSRFEGQGWEVVYSVDRGYMHPVLAGCGGMMLCHTSITHLEFGYTTEYALFRNKTLINIAPLRKLIADHADLIITGFPPSYTPVQYGGHSRFWIATDTQRNIWLRDRNGAGVFTGSKWIMARDVPGTPISVHVGESQGPLSVGDGSKVFLSNTIASLEGEKMTFIAVPASMSVDGQMPFGFRDRQGVFFLPSHAKEITPSKFSRGTLEYLRNPPRREVRTIRISEKGPLEELPVEGWPCLIDQSGNVWLAEMGRGRPRAHFWIWRDGKVLQELQISNSTYMGAICSDKPGSVYVGTNLGLHHLVADERSDQEFQLRQTYAIPVTIPNQFYCPYSDLVGLAIPGTSAITFIRLPEE